MNRRNFFGTVGAAVAGLVLGSNIKATQPAATWGFATGDNLLLKPATVTFDSVNGLRLYNNADLYVREFTADEIRVGGGAQRWQVGIGDDGDPLGPSATRFVPIGMTIGTERGYDTTTTAPPIYPAGRPLARRLLGYLIVMGAVATAVWLTAWVRDIYLYASNFYA